MNHNSFARSVILVLSDYALPITIKTDWFEVTTKSAGIVIIFFAVWLAMDINLHSVKRGYEVGRYDFVPRGVRTVECSECPSEMPIDPGTYSACGYERPLY